jgi:hypothetical protein
VGAVDPLVEDVVVETGQIHDVAVTQEKNGN